MTKTQKILLGIIILGLGLLATQKFWLPALTRMILTEKNYDATNPGEICFNYKHMATDTEPYTVEENMKIGILNGKVTGIKSGTQSGPDMTNGYTGTLEGEKKNDTLDLIYSYTVEGANQKEEEIYNISKNSLVKMRYVLKEEAGVLVPDKNSTPKFITYELVDCGV